ncbi:endonuclease/exonuclease/phosphatase family protein, partial [Streptococcus pyogenes]|uniref:endonuclease/exonuclease/phosphatase family protein n=1 Tax=Streptococcus pyogenes TaxID=1314 RepID=UPI0034DD3B36
NGLNDRTKRASFVHWLQCSKADVVCLQETHAASHGDIRSWCRNSGFTVASSSISNKRAGTAILVGSQHQVHQVWRDEEGRLTQVELSIGEHRFRVVSLYAPSRNPARNQFLRSVSDYLDLSIPTIICGDFNSVLDPDLDRLHPPTYQRSAPSPHAESIPALQSLMSSTQTFPVWRTLHPNVRAYSWVHGSGSVASRIDMILAPIGMRDQIKECEYRTASFVADHRYLYLESSLEGFEPRGPGYWKLNTSLLRDDKYRDLVAAFWSFWKTQEKSGDFSSLLDWWDMGKSLVREATRSFACVKAMTQSSAKKLLQRQ